MNIKDRLKAYKWTRDNIAELEERLVEIDTRLYKTTSHMSAEPGSPNSGGGDPWNSLIAQKIEIEQKIQKEIECGYVEMRTIEALFDSLPEREKYLMRARYVCGLSWEQIAVDMGYSWQHIHRLHGEVLETLREEVKQ